MFDVIEHERFHRASGCGYSLLEFGVVDREAIGDHDG